MLREAQGVGLGLFVICALGRHHRRSGLTVPAGVMLQVETIGIGHRMAKVVAGDGLIVVARDIEVHALTEAFRP